MFGTAIIGAGSHALLKTLSPYNRASHCDIIYFLEKFMIIKKDTIIHLNGIPFKLAEDTKVLGSEENLKLALELGDNNEGRKGSCDENP